MGLLISGFSLNNFQFEDDCSRSKQRVELLIMEVLSQSKKIESLLASKEVGHEKHYFFTYHCCFFSWLQR